ncbi:hypothetical protein VHEMI04238 [[Torrubiella] hemipterigena]|uniref:tripeptidyl-peptidase II n=1 Tax=[Torrubiella] hemipterigena TaxID=1531966 RepID=A0A0A1TFT9_9HYPO|nr:hypothetical protein VHEMI04238 [[Torrubiella] hemipterigena]
MKVAAIFLSAFVAAALGMPADYVQHENIGNAPHLIKRAGAALDNVVPVRIALKQNNLDKGMDLLMDVSDPDSANYGKHWTAEQVAEKFAPAEGSADAVTKWLVEAGVPAASIKIPKSKGWVEFQSTVGKLENLLHTKYNVFESRDTAKQFLGTEKYNLPAAVADHVDFVSPGVAMYKMRKVEGNPIRKNRPSKPLSADTIAKLQSQGQSSDCGTIITPACIKDMYKIADAPTTANPNNKLGMFEDSDEMYRQSDLDIFYKNYAPNIPKGFGPKVDLLNFGSSKPNPNSAVGEAALDFDMVFPIIYPQGSELYQSKSQSQDLFDHFLDAIDGSFCDGDDTSIDGSSSGRACGTFKPSNVFSFSYGVEEGTWPLKYTQRQCNEFMKLGLQGSTIVFASGDGGVAGGHGGRCSGDGSVFTGIVHGGCPYVTSVGATELPSGSNAGDPEHVAFTQFSPGGGFSNYYVRPDYQNDAVSSFLANHAPSFQGYNNTDGTIPADGSNGVYNMAGRGFPDISAIGNNGAYVFNGQPGTNGGTSMSAPVVAAMFNLINENRLAAGKKTIGFANPALYKNTAMFTDVTIGGMAKDDSAACNGNSFDATPGWDPASGLGSPKYPEMSKYFMSL